MNRLDAMNRLGKAMADPVRSRILLSLLDRHGYPAQLARDLGLTRSNVSNHLACLRGCGIVVAEPEGRRTRYDISDPHLTRKDPERWERATVRVIAIAFFALAAYVIIDAVLTLLGVATVDEFEAMPRAA